MKDITINILCVLILFNLQSCSSPSSMSQVNPLISSVDSVHSIVDIAKKVSVQPSDNNNIMYSESDAFDLALLASMKGEVSPINVQINSVMLLQQFTTPSTITAATPRIERWLWKIRDSGGEVIACEEGSRALWVVLIPIVIGLVADLIKDYVTYQLADQYNAKVFYNPGNQYVQRVEFQQRKQQSFSCNESS